MEVHVFYTKSGNVNSPGRLVIYFSSDECDWDRADVTFPGVNVVRVRRNGKLKVDQREQGGNTNRRLDVKVGVGGGFLKEFGTLVLEVTRTYDEFYFTLPPPRERPPLRG